MIRILWVDDEVDMLRPHMLFLRTKGYDVVGVTNGADALDVLAEEAFSLVLLDENMPGLSGLDTLARIHREHPHVPVVMITKSEEENLMNEAIGRSITDYLIKPVSPTQVLSCIKKNLQRSELIAAHVQTSYRQEFAVISQMISAAGSHEDWIEIYSRLAEWELRMADAEPVMQEMLDMQLREGNSAFARHVERSYREWIASSSHPLMSHDIMSRRVAPRIADGEKVALLIIDNLRLDHWLSIRQLIAEGFYLDEEICTSILPTTTRYARNAIFAGMLPAEIARRFPQWWNTSDGETLNSHEGDLLAASARDMRPVPECAYHKLSKSDDIHALTECFARRRIPQLLGIVVGFVDTLSHARTESEMLRELAADDAAYRNLTLSWFRSSGIADLIRSAANAGYTVLLTSDHGSIRVDNPVMTGAERDAEASMRHIAGKRLSYPSKRTLVATTPASLGLPSSSATKTYVLATGQDFFLFPNDFNRFARHFNGSFQHGGISLQEMLVPFVTLSAK